jgi:hypothetical protein
MQSFHQTIYFNFMVTIDEIFPDEEHMNKNFEFRFNYQESDIFENTFLSKVEIIMYEKYKVQLTPLYHNPHTMDHLVQKQTDASKFT